MITMEKTLNELRKARSTHSRTVEWLAGLIAKHRDQLRGEYTTALQARIQMEREHYQRAQREILRLGTPAAEPNPQLLYRVRKATENATELNRSLERAFPQWLAYSIANPTTPHRERAHAAQ